MLARFCTVYLGQIAWLVHVMPGPIEIFKPELFIVVSIVTGFIVLVTHIWRSVEGRSQAHSSREQLI
jgi:hypothetical protein